MTMDVIGKLTFKGGIHPPEMKNLSENSPITILPNPKEVYIHLSQHIGAPCRPLVKKGDTVTIGQKIGDCDAFVSAPIHSPVNGKIKEISLHFHPVLGRNHAIFIENEQPAVFKAPSFDSFNTDLDTEKYTSEQICEAVRQAGIVGMGGAGFPTRVKLEPSPEMPKETLIVNGCECEPYITCDYRVMMEWTKQVICGIKLAKQASGCSKVYIAIEDNKPQAFELFNKTLQNTKNSQDIKVVQVKTKYPQGGERQLIYSVLNTNVPTNGIPPMIGVVVINVATAAAIAEAVVLNQPLTHRVVTVAGAAIANPMNLYVPIGTPVSELIEFCGGATEKSPKVIMGGPMMGITLSNLATPITKTSGAITVLTKKQIGAAKFERRTTACIRCGRCLQVCPENLNPTKIAHAVKFNNLELAQTHFMTACIECGCCSYICPANIELTGYIKAGKIMLAKQKKKML